MEITTCSFVWGKLKYTVLLKKKECWFHGFIINLRKKDLNKNMVWGWQKLSPSYCLCLNSKLVYRSHVGLLIQEPHFHSTNWLQYNISQTMFLQHSLKRSHSQTAWFKTWQNADRSYLSYIYECAILTRQEMQWRVWVSLITRIFFPQKI